MKRKIALLSLLLGCSTISFSNGLNVDGGKTYTNWVDQNNNQISDIKDMENKNSLSGLFLITPNLNWYEEWQKPGKARPAFEQTNTVKIGESVSLLSFFSNPSINDKNEYSINCNLKIRNSKGEILIDGEVAPCSSGKKEDKMNSIFMTEIPLNFTPTKEDPTGEWNVTLKITDNIKNNSVLIEETFNVVE